MAVTKTNVISVRVPPEVKAALTAAAHAERRSLATMVEVMVLDYCQTRSIPLPAAEMAVAETSAPSRKKPKKTRKT